MSDENSYYAWGEIEKVRAKMLVDEREVSFVDYGAGRPHPTSPTKGKGRDYRRICDIAKGSLAKKKYAQMLARLVNWLGRPLLTSPSMGGIGDGGLVIGDWRLAIGDWRLAMGDW